MTPHSVRRPDGYCLNEITKALERQLTVIPVMVVQSEPPLSICRTQWLDMRDCVPVQERKEKYEAKFARLIEALEDDRIDFEGVQMRLIQRLSPLPLEADILPHLKRFTGRQWVFDRIDAWLADDKASQVFWITRKPGVGKNELASFIASEFDKTPDWLRLIITSRPEPEVTHPLQALTSYVLDASTPENEDDIRDFLKREFKIFTGGKEVEEDVIKAIIEKSEGIFLYVEWIRKELMDKRLSLDKLDNFPHVAAGKEGRATETSF